MAKTFAVQVGGPGRGEHCQIDQGDLNGWQVDHDGADWGSASWHGRFEPTGRRWSANGHTRVEFTWRAD